MEQSNDTSEPSPPDKSFDDLLDQIGSGREIAEKKQGPDNKDRIEKEEQEIALLRARVEALKSKTSLREGYERKVYKYLVWYSVCAFAIIVYSGMGYLVLDKEVLLAVAGSTAISAIGLVAQIGKGLFGPDENKEG